MSWLIDTSVLIGTVQTGSARHFHAMTAVATLFGGEDALCIVPQNIIEFWAVATRPRDANGLGLSITDTQNEIDKIKLQFILKNEDSTIFVNWEKLVADYSVIGKTELTTLD